MTSSGDSFVPLAIIRHPHGLRGEVKIASLATPPDSIFAYALHDADGTVFRLTRTGSQPNIFLCRIDGITDRNQSEALKGKVLGVLRSALPVDEDAVYVHDLVGASVVTSSGEAIGIVRDVVNYGAADIVIISTADNDELMLPYASQFFPEPLKDGLLLCHTPEVIEGEER